MLLRVCVCFIIISALLLKKVAHCYENKQIMVVMVI